MTVRDLIHDIQVELRDKDVPPVRASELLLKATALIGNVSGEIREADLDYSRVLLLELETEKRANRARIKAEVSPAYQRKREARDAQVLLVELIRSLRQVLRTQSDEMRLQR